VHGCVRSFNGNGCEPLFMVSARSTAGSRQTLGRRFPRIASIWACSRSCCVVSPFLPASRAAFLAALSSLATSRFMRGLCATTRGRARSPSAPKREKRRRSVTPPSLAVRRWMQLWELRHDYVRTRPSESKLRLGRARPSLMKRRISQDTLRFSAAARSKSLASALSVFRGWLTLRPHRSSGPGRCRPSGGVAQSRRGASERRSFRLRTCRHRPCYRRGKGVAWKAAF
jgi:hypothetical protein